MKSKLTIILLLTILFGCGNTVIKKDSTNKTDKVTEISFKDFSDKIPLLTLPLSSNCETGFNVTRYGFTNNEILKFGRDNCSILGKLVDNEKYTAIIYLQPCDTQLPIIVTTDKYGRKIAELELYDGYCGEEEDFNEISYFSIDKDLNILMTDSSTTFKRDEKIEIIESSKQTTVTYKHFRINTDGKIIKQKEKNAP